MRESQAEIKAIEAQLRSIRVESGRVESGRVESGSSPKTSSTLMESRSMESRPTLSQSRNPTVLNHSAQVRQGQERPTKNRAVQHPITPKVHTTEHLSHSNPSEVPSSQTHSAQGKPASSKQVEGYPLPPKHRLPNHLEATVARLQEQSARYVEQFVELQSPSFRTPAQLFEQTLAILDAQVQHINQLSAVQESAVLELKTIAEQVEREWKTLEHSHEDYVDAELDILPICEYVGTAVPKIEKNKNGVYVLSARSIDLFKAEREAAFTAQSLRHWANRRSPAETQSSLPSLWQRLTRLLSPVDLSATKPDSRSTDRAEVGSPSISGTHSLSSRQIRSPRRRSARTIVHLKQAVALFLGAVLVRMVLDMVLATFPVLWTPAIALLVTPAAIAVYRSSATPQAGIIWGYRLLVIMMGLLVGGRL